MPIAVPVPERRAQAEGKLPAEGQPPREQRDRGARREKRTRERPPPSGEAPPPEGSQAPVESRQAPSVALESGGPPTQEQSMGGPPGVHRRGSRRGGAQRGERFGGHGTPGIEAEGASKAVDAPPGTEHLYTSDSQTGCKCADCDTSIVFICRLLAKRIASLLFEQQKAWLRHYLERAEGICIR